MVGVQKNSIRIVLDHASRPWSTRIGEDHARGSTSSRQSSVSSTSSHARAWMQNPAASQDILERGCWSSNAPALVSRTHTPHLTARFSFNRFSGADSRASASLLVASLPMPKNTSSGVCPQNAEWGITRKRSFRVMLRQRFRALISNPPDRMKRHVPHSVRVFLSKIGSGWREVLIIVQPDTVIRWHRTSFWLYWRFISKRGPGRPPIPVEVQDLIRRFANENGWRARKVQAELEKLGFRISLVTVS
jgi:hypothetical protein